MVELGREEGTKRGTGYTCPPLQSNIRLLFERVNKLLEERCHVLVEILDISGVKTMVAIVPYLIALLIEHRVLFCVPLLVNNRVTLLVYLSLHYWVHVSDVLHALSNLTCCHLSTQSLCNEVCIDEQYLNIAVHVDG